MATGVEEATSVDRKLRPAVRSIDRGDTETIHVFNKVDRLGDEETDALRHRFTDAVFISAMTGEGIDALYERIEAFFFGRNVRVEVKIPAGDGRAIARIRRLLQDVSDSYLDDICVLNGIIVSARMSRLESVPGAQVRYLF